MTNKEFIGRHIANSSGEEAFDTMYTFATGLKCRQIFTKDEYRKYLIKWLDEESDIIGKQEV